MKRFSPLQEQGPYIGRNEQITQDGFFASAETRQGREEAEKVRCPSAQPCDQLDGALQLPRKESTSGEKVSDWFTVHLCLGGKT